MIFNPAYYLALTLKEGLRKVFQCKGEEVEEADSCHGHVVVE